MLGIGCLGEEILAATTFAEATVVKKNAKVTKI